MFHKYFVLWIFVLIPLGLSAKDEMPPWNPRFESLLISPPSDDWNLTWHPLDNVIAVLVPKEKPKQGHFLSNMNLIRDQTAVLFNNLDHYVESALQILKEQQLQEVLETKRLKSKALGDYYLIYSKKPDQEVYQAVFHKAGYGFFILTGSFELTHSKKQYADFLKLIEEAKFQ